MKYFTSDLHIGDDRLGIIPNKPNVFYRPFKSIKEQNDIILNNLRDIKPNDELYILGDVVYDLSYIRELDRLPNCTRILIKGNYDTDKLNYLFPYFDYVHEHLILIEDGFDSTIYMNHYPTKCMEYMKKYSECKLSFTGHIHSLWKVQPNMINVSTDVWNYKPIDIDTLKFCWEACQKFYDQNVFPYKKFIR